MPGALLLLASLLALPSADPAAVAEYQAAAPAAERGLYAIWAGNKPALLDLPFVHGGQAVVQWAWLEPAPGEYDWSRLDAILQALHERRSPGTVQVNGNLKPAWLYERVPSRPDKLSIQIGDDQGTLMYWHPNHRKAYTDFIAAYGRHIAESPYHDAVLGVRLNFNALGTEHMHLKPPDRDPAKWTFPPGVEPGPAYDASTVPTYQRAVVDAFVQAFRPHTRVFVRNNIEDDLRQTYATEFASGDLCWFHTSSELEPRYEAQYRTFLDWCRSGKTVAYAESWADAWGAHGIRDPRWCSPPQWNWWRLLIDLHCGVSFIAVYGNDLQVALDGTTQGKNKETKPSYQAEFTAAFEFAAKYAGYHASPTQSPGAWVAFRSEQENVNYQKPLKDLTGDYTFLAGRVLPDQTVPLRLAGPDDQRFGAWAVKLPAGEQLTVRLDEQFAASLQGRPAAISVTWLDEGAGNLTIAGGGATQTVARGGSGRWQTATVPLESAAFEAARAVTVTAEADLTLHMIEVTRG